MITGHRSKQNEKHKNEHLHHGHQVQAAAYEEREKGMYKESIQDKGMYEESTQERENSQSTVELRPFISSSSDDDTPGMGRRRKRMETSLFDALQERHEGGCLKAVYDFNLHPHSPFHSCWDTWILLLVFYSTIMEPYKWAFRSASENSASSIGLLVDLFFYADMAINFFTGFDVGVEVIMDKRLIVRNYLGGWFWIDFVATVQWDLIIEAIAGMTSDYIGLCRLIKVARLAKANGLIQRLTASWTVHTGFINAATFSSYVLLCAHIMACLFFKWPELFSCPKELWYPGTPATNITNATDPTPPVAFDAGYHCTLNPIGGVHTLGDCDHSCLPKSWRTLQIPDDRSQPPYLHSLYWAITTMTTIGYGDRLPTQKCEIVLVLFCEMVGLAFFGLLLTMVNDLNDVMGATQHKADTHKNNVVGFMKTAGHDDEIMGRVISFLNFKATSLSGHTVSSTSLPTVDELSYTLRKELLVSTNLPALRRVRFFGHAQSDVDENNRIATMFKKVDSDGSGKLDSSELGKLCLHLGHKADAEVLSQMMHEMDYTGEGTVQLMEFQIWYYANKYGRPCWAPCPVRFLDTIAGMLTIQPFGPLEQVQKPGEYGNSLCIVLTGSVDILSHRNLRASSHAHSHSSSAPAPGAKKMRTVDVVRTIAANDREPIWGMSAGLRDPMYSAIEAHTAHWSARSSNNAFVDMGVLTRPQLLYALKHYWGYEGFDRFKAAAKYWYEMDGLDLDPMFEEDDRLHRPANQEGIDKWKKKSEHGSHIKPQPPSALEAQVVVADTSARLHTLEKRAADWQNALAQGTGGLLLKLDKLAALRNKRRAAKQETPKAATKRALLTGLRNGKLEKAVEKMEADEIVAATAPPPPSPAPPGQRSSHLTVADSTDSSAPAPAPGAKKGDNTETPKAATKRALLTGLRNGNLEKAVEKMEADEIENLI